MRVLLKSPKSPEVGEEDTFSYNADFSNPLYRIRINNIQMKETTEENVKTNEQVRARCRVLAGKQHHLLGWDVAWGPSSRKWSCCFDGCTGSAGGEPPMAQLGGDGSVCHCVSGCTVRYNLYFSSCISCMAWQLVKAGVRLMMLPYTSINAQDLLGKEHCKQTSFY